MWYLETTYISQQTPEPQESDFDSFKSSGVQDVP